MPRIRRLPRLQQSERLQKPHIAHDRLPVPLQFARELRNGYRPRTNSLQHPDAFGREYLYQVRRVFKNHSDLGRYAFTPIQLARALAGSRKELVHGPSRSEERRVGKEGRFRWAPYHLKKKSSLHRARFRFAESTHAWAAAFYGSPLPQTRLLHQPFIFSSRRRHTRLQGDWSSDVCSSD